MRGGGACLNGLSDPSWPPFDRKLQSAHDSACRHSLCRSLLARRRPGRQCFCDNPVGDELAEAGAPADLIDDRAAVGAEGRRSEQWIDRGAREPARAAARRRGGDLTGEAAFAQIEFAADSPLERTGLEPSVPLLRKALLGVGNWRRVDERRIHSETAMLAWSGSPWPFPRGGTLSSNPSSSCEARTNLYRLGQVSETHARFIGSKRCDVSVVVVGSTRLMA